jgi:hypothetical protein
MLFIDVTDSDVIGVAHGRAGFSRIEPPNQYRRATQQWGKDSGLCSLTSAPSSGEDETARGLVLVSCSEQQPSPPLQAI